MSAASMFLLSSIIVVGLFAVLGLSRLLLAWKKHQRQVRFIRAILSTSRKRDHRRVVVSLSTVPDRMNNLGPTIRSLLRQTRPPDEIVLAIPEFSIREQRPYVIPEYISQLSHLEILRCQKDWGPATKFIPVVQRELEAGRGDSLIMVVDDDRSYPRDAVETYLHYNEQLPDAALCFRGALMPRNFDWRTARMTFGNELREPRLTSIITGCGSYFIQPRLFDESLWDYSGAPGGAFYMDDIWISGCLSRRAVERYVVPASAMMRTVLRQRWTLSLHDVPGGRQPSNNETISFFRDTWNVFDTR